MFIDVIQIGNDKILVNGKETAPLPKKFNHSYIFQNGENIYWNGYKYNLKNDSWKWSFYGWIMCYFG